MGPRLKLPPYVHGFIDRNGKPRFYFRRRSYKSLPLPGLPWSPTFMAAYETAMQGEPPVRIEIGSSRTTPGTVNAAIISYFNSSAFQALAAETRRSRRGILERFRAEHGDKRIALLQRAHIDRIVAAKAATPSAARNFLKALKALMAFCIANHLRDDDPTVGVKSAKINGRLCDLGRTSYSRVRGATPDRFARSAGPCATALHRTTTLGCGAAGAAAYP
jgi:hypothetical protein